MAGFQNKRSSFSIGLDPDARVLAWVVASKASTVSNDDYLSQIPHPPRISNFSPSSQLYDGNPLPSQSYDPSYISFQQADLENARHTPRSLEWGPHGADFVKLYKFVVPKGKLPYLELLDKWTPTYQTPRRVYLDEPRGNEKDQFPCQYPGTCNAKQTVFSHPVDLERHYKDVHAEKDSFPCDYPKCPRSQDPFSRKHHYRDHLRDFHKEDIGSAKTQRSSKDKRTWQQEKIWLAERNISLKYWRCTKCLVRNSVYQEWDCSSCKNPCEEERVRIRRARGAPYCFTCSDTGYCDNSGAYELCPVCQPTTFDSGNIAGLPEMYSFEEPVEEDGVRVRKCLRHAMGMTREWPVPVERARSGVISQTGVAQEVDGNSSPPPFVPQS